MENSDQETLATVTLATPALSTSPDVNETERHPKKKKLYRQHFVALLERCEIIQQVKCLGGATPYAVYTILLQYCFFCLSIVYVCYLNIKGQRTSSTQDTSSGQTVKTDPIGEKVGMCFYYCKDSIKCNLYVFRFIMDRLDTHKDNWREAELKIDLGTDLPLPEAVNLKVISAVYKIFII